MRLPRPARGWGVPATASPPTESPPQYSPALRWVTTGFGMGPGGASALSATGTPHPPAAGSEGRRHAHVSPHAPPTADLPARPPARSSARPARKLTISATPDRTGPASLDEDQFMRQGASDDAPLPGACPPGLHWKPTTDVLLGTLGFPPSAIRTARLQSVT